MRVGLTAIALVDHDVIVLEGCDGTGKTTLAGALGSQHGYTIIHSGRTPESTDLAGRYRQLLCTPGKIVLDRSFISELVYGPLFHGGSRLTLRAATSLACRAVGRGGILVHLTGDPHVIAARLECRDGTAPPLDRIRRIIDAYHATFRLLADAVPVVTVDTTSASADP